MNYRIVEMKTRWQNEIHTYISVFSVLATISLLSAPQGIVPKLRINLELTYLNKALQQGISPRLSLDLGEHPRILWLAGKILYQQRSLQDIALFLNILAERTGLECAYAFVYGVYSLSGE